MTDEVAKALAASANPERATAALQRLAERNPAGRAGLDGEGLRRLVVVAGMSEVLGETVAAGDEALDVLTGDLTAWSAAEVRNRCERRLASDQGSAAAALAIVQRLGLLNVAARDALGLAPGLEATHELADLADGVLAAALHHVADQRARVAVIALGKLGGRELNYVSDVDVVFVAEGEMPSATRTVTDLLRLLGEVTPAGRAYEVDPNLRPEGRDGPLVRSLDAYRAYYQRWAKTWEFQALLKARPVAGDRELGAAFMAMAEAFVWPDRLDGEAVAEIQRLKAVVEGSASVVRAGLRQVKLAPGGLRDIEFAVQLLQLVHGRHDRDLRNPNTLVALAALAAGGYVGRPDGAAFANAYVFLRTVEHRLQLVRLRRTHTLPQRPDDRRRLARSMGFVGDDALDRFDTELRRLQGLVRTLHEKLFYRPLLSRFAQLAAAEQLMPSGGTRLDEAAVGERLVALGFAQPRQAIAHLEAMASGVTRRARMLQTALPAVLPTLASAPDPDGGLAALRSLTDRAGEAPELLRTLRDNPPVADLLAQVLGASPLVGSWLERQPEVIGAFSDLALLQEHRGGRSYAGLAEGLLRRGQDAAGAAEALRRLRRREVARTAVRDLAGMADVVDIAAELSGIAEACLHAGVELVVPAGVTLAVVGLGKLGGGELGYASDLDLLLIAEPAEARLSAERAAEELLRLLSGITPEGQAFKVDVNLRPEGKDGPLVRTLASYRSYYQRWAEPWELQALTQARHVAGDRSLGQAFVAMLSDLVYTWPVPPDRLTAMRQMKARVERERTGMARSKVRRIRPSPRRADLKLGAGGVSDVEWTVQLLQLRHGGRLPSLRRPGVLAALEACAGEGLISEGDAEWLAQGWRFLTRLRNMLYLAALRDSDRLPAVGSDLERVAAMLGYDRPGAQALGEDVFRVTRRVRRVHERLFYG
ncbi:MAG: bifunctional [glutamine synthetase] adenylyltransferase/[glutamine synthetase]-adenylyl-L-tyrosine phosphorylase [Actinomycetota bacterium]|jgi:glutamate-ammonia-ligase adenylyltransferase|nr:bifunctional [glutamine synthetase] adenylyltransferase/[glutamine synthetase]-adenylyl-L-tyrosine phosphorylase [Actinomycetota bacterium]